MATFEQYASQRLAEIIGETISAELQPDKTSVILGDTDDSRRFLVAVGLTIDCIYEAKVQAADVADELYRAVKLIGRDNFVSRVNVLTMKADRKGLLGKWQYRIETEFLVKAGVSW